MSLSKSLAVASTPQLLNLSTSQPSSTMANVRLSVNINKIALIRNSRGSNLPDLTQIARDCEAFGAQGITVHPRPDERHVRFDDLPLLKDIVSTEFNIEGNPAVRF